MELRLRVQLDPEYPVGGGNDLCRAGELGGQDSEVVERGGIELRKRSQESFDNNDRSGGDLSARRVAFDSCDLLLP